MVSKRLQKASADNGEELQVDMSPMIDMAFLLLIFFLVTATLKIVNMDPLVNIPIAPDGRKQDTSNGRIVVNVYEDGTYATERGKEQPLDGDYAIVEYLQTQKENLSSKFTPILHLRADTSAAFFRARYIVRLAARVGITDIRFASYETDK